MYVGGGGVGSGSGEKILFVTLLVRQNDVKRSSRSRGMEGGSGVVYRVVGRTRKADCGQQTERQPPAPRQDTTWKKYTDSPGVGAPPLVRDNSRHRPYTTYEVQNSNIVSCRPADV
ncbi:hypothetical protein MSG28_000292, partial [Choristoneura fumiferana]